MIKNSIKWVAATLFISAENIGTYLFIVPFALGIAGFFPGLFSIVISWLFVFLIALLYLECIFSRPDGVNLLSLTEFHFGKKAKWMVALLYFLLVNYPVQAGLLKFSLPFLHLLSPWLGISSDLLFAFITSFLLGVLIFWGIVPTLIVNFLLMTGLFFAFSRLTSLGAPFVENVNLTRSEWPFLFLPIAILISATGFQPILPTIATFLNRNKTSLVFSILFGTLIPFILFGIISWLIIGSFSPESFLRLFEESHDPSSGLSLLGQLGWLTPILNLLYFFLFSTAAIVIYYIGLEILLDGANIPVHLRKGKVRALASLFVFLPPLVYLFFTDKFFYLFENFFMDFVSLFLSLLPLLFVWRSRYRLKLDTPQFLCGGRPLLIFLFFGLFYLIWCEILALF